MAQNIFADRMLEGAWTDRPLANLARRSWATVTSFGLQAILIGLLLLLPLLKTVGVPLTRRTVPVPISAGNPNPGPAPIHPHRGLWTQIVSTPARFVAPGQIPRTIEMTDGNPTAPAFSAACTGICDPSVVATGPGIVGFPIPLSGTRLVMPAAPPKPTHAFRTSSMLEGSLIRRVDPVYPSLARNARVQGSVVLFATISTAGMIENLRVLSGHPLLVSAAIDAVKQWRYRPYILNGEPIQVQTEITVNFVLEN
jgi:periplasmic protein TonB